MELLIKLIPGLLFIIYWFFIPISVLILSVIFTVQMHLMTNIININMAFLFMITITVLKNTLTINKRYIKLIIYLFILTVLITILHDVNLYFLISFLFIVIHYIDIYNSKYNNIILTLKNLKPSFYLFVTLTFSLFVFKYYLLINNITQPSFYYLFITIPISGLIIYFYSKDLKPVFDKLVKENKKVNSN